MTFFEEIQKTTRMVEEEKEKARIEMSNTMILDTNKSIKESATLGHHMCKMYYCKKDCDIGYIVKHYANEGFNVSNRMNEKMLVISW